jgi:cysteine synthase
LTNQYENEDNVRAHYETTGPEIWRQTEGRVRYFVAGLGTTGTITGTGRYLKERDPSIKIIAIEPNPGHRLPGLKSFAEAKEPGILDWSVIDDVIHIDDDDAYATTKRLHREEGLIVGPSTGAVVSAIRRLPDTERDIAVGISPDSGTKYASYFADILGDEGLPQI